MSVALDNYLRLCDLAGQSGCKLELEPITRRAGYWRVTVWESDSACAAEGSGPSIDLAAKAALFDWREEAQAA